MKPTHLLLLVILLGLFLTLAQAQRTGGARGREQSQFSMEEDFARPVRVPADVLRMLLRDEDNRRVLESTQSPDAALASWLTASEIHLNNDRLPDLVVMATGSLRGANITPFWVFLNTPRGYRQVLSTAAHGLTVMNTRTRGHRNIRRNAMTAVDVIIETFRFNGREYKSWRYLREPIQG